jgi:hypothetical protein
MIYHPFMTNDPETLAELVKTNETLDEIRRYAKFADQVLKIRIVLYLISIAAAFVIAGILLFPKN